MATTPIFRSHEQVPARVGSPLVRHLLQEWVLVNRASSSRRTLARWAREDAAFISFTNPAQIVDAIDTAPRSEVDELFIRLVSLSQEGEQIAARTLLQCLLPGLTKWRARGQRPDQSPEDRLQEIVADFYLVLASFPTDEPQVNVASRLLDRTLRRSTPTKQEAWEQSMLYRVGQIRPPEDAARIDEHDPDAGEISVDGLLAWAVEQEIINASDAALLADVYQSLPGTTTLNYAEAAQRRGISNAAARKRCSRATQAIIEVVNSRARAPIAPAASAPEVEPAPRSAQAG